jgi:DNA-binding CsgD family transcriptional regulator
MSKTDQASGPLTRRQLEILNLLCKGYTSKEVASRLGISTKTAEKHRSNIMKKSGVDNTVRLLLWSLVYGKVDYMILGRELMIEQLLGIPEKRRYEDIKEESAKL